jgi:hypothetical protein
LVCICEANLEGCKCSPLIGPSIGLGIAYLVVKVISNT